VKPTLAPEKSETIKHNDSLFYACMNESMNSIAACYSEHINKLVKQKQVDEIAEFLSGPVNQLLKQKKLLSSFGK